MGLSLPNKFYFNKSIVTTFVKNALTNIEPLN